MKLENDNRSVIGKSTKLYFVWGYRISRGGGVGRRVFFADMSFGSKREINSRTLYPVPALRGLKRCKTHVRPRLLPMWWRQVCYHCRSSTLLMMWELQFASQEVSKKERSLFRHLFSRVMASYETIKMHPWCNTSYTRGWNKGSQGRTYGHCVLAYVVSKLSSKENSSERKLLSIIFSQIY